jgi:hypothetical protein
VQIPCIKEIMNNNTNNNNTAPEKTYISPLVLSTAGIIPTKSHNSLKLFKSPPYSIYGNEENNNTQNMLHSQKVFGTTVNNKCLVSEKESVRNVRKVDDDDDNDDENDGNNKQ